MVRPGMSASKIIGMPCAVLRLWLRVILRRRTECEDVRIWSFRCCFICFSHVMSKYVRYTDLRAHEKAPKAAPKWNFRFFPLAQLPRFFYWWHLATFLSLVLSCSYIINDQWMLMVDDTFFDKHGCGAWDSMSCKADPTDLAGSWSEFVLACLSDAC